MLLSHIIKEKSVPKNLKRNSTSSLFARWGYRVTRHPHGLQLRGMIAIGFADQLWDDD